MMILFTYGLTELDELGFISVIIGFILLILFIRFEKKSSEPIFNLSLFKDTHYVIGNYAAMVTYFTTTIAITALSFHMQFELDFEEHILSLILMISPIIMIFMSNVSGKLSNTVDPRLISATAMIFIFLSMVLFACIAHISFELIVLACIFQGIGNGLFSAPNNKYVLTLVDPEDLADASSFLSTSKEFGKILSTGIYTLIFSIFLGTQTLGSDSMGTLLIRSTNLMMTICALMALSGVILLLYSKYKFDFQINEKTVELFKSIMPKWIKKFI